MLSTIPAEADNRPWIEVVRKKERVTQKLETISPGVEAVIARKPRTRNSVIMIDLKLDDFLALTKRMHDSIGQ